MKKNTIKYLQDIMLAARIAKNGQRAQDFKTQSEKFKSSLCALLVEEAITKDEYNLWMKMWKKV